MSGDILEQHVGYSPHLNVQGINVAIRVMLDGIKGGRWDKKIAKLREMGRDSPQYGKRKAELPFFMISATTSGRFRACDVTGPTGFLQLDVDKVGADHAGGLRDTLGKDPHILAAFVSPSGDGVKAIMRIPASIEGHKAAFAAASAYMMATYSLEIDPQCCNVNRLCFVSHDPGIVVNVTAEVLPVLPLSQDVHGQEQQQENHETRRETVEGETDGGDSSTFLSPECSVLCNATSSVLCNNGFFDENPSLKRIYCVMVTGRIGKPRKGTRNQAMVEIVSHCYPAAIPEFVASFAEEYFREHADVFADYDFPTYQREVRTMLDGCCRDYPKRLSDAERAVYESLDNDRDRAAFRITQSLAFCDTDSTAPPPLFFLSCANLGARLGLLNVQADRILKRFMVAGIINREKVGTRHYMEPGAEKLTRGTASVYRWML